MKLYVTCLCWKDNTENPFCFFSRRQGAIAGWASVIGPLSSCLFMFSYSARASTALINLSTLQMNMCVQLVREAKWQAGGFDNSSTKTMISVRNTGLMFIYPGDSLGSQKGICGLHGHTSQEDQDHDSQWVGTWNGQRGGWELFARIWQFSNAQPAMLSNAALSNFLCTLPFLEVWATLSHSLQGRMPSSVLF